MKRDLKLCYLILKQIVDYYAPSVPINIIRNIEPYSSDEVLFNSRLLDNIFIKRHLIDCNATVEITWQGIELYEELKSKFEVKEASQYKPIGRDYMEDILGLLNHNILKQIDEEECKKIMDCINKELDKKPFVVVSVTSGYNTIKSVDYVDRFNSKSEAEAFIKEHYEKNSKLYEDRKTYSEEYLRSLNEKDYSNVARYLGMNTGPDPFKFIVDYLLNEQNVDSKIFINYNAPKRSNDKGIYFTIELKENV